MTYAAEEISVQDGAPVELYEFGYGSTALYYTSSGQGYTDASVSPSQSYTSANIERSAISSTEEKARNSLTLTVPRTFAIAELFRVSPPSDTVNVTLRRVHRGDTASVVVAWMGRVLSCQFNGAKATLQCEPISVSLRRSGLRRIYGRACPHVLYGTACGLNKSDFDHATTVSSISGLTLTVGSIGAYSYAGGFVEWVNDAGNTERRFIESHVGTALTLMQAFAGIANTDAVTIYPGCDHTLAACDAFGNVLNYGGWPWIPNKNPWAGDPVFV